MTVEDAHAAVCADPSDLIGCLPTLRELAAQVADVVEFGTGSGRSATAFLAGQPESLKTYDVEHHPGLRDRLELVRGRTRLEVHRADVLEIPPIECDLLFVDTIHTGRHLWQELSRHGPGVRRWIVLHDTVSYFDWDGMMDEPGLGPAIRRWLQTHPEWHVWRHLSAGHGLTVLSCRPEDHPLDPPPFPVVIS